jgi:hypothetical protein
MSLRLGDITKVTEITFATVLRKIFVGFFISGKYWI